MMNEEIDKIYEKRHPINDVVEIIIWLALISLTIYGTLLALDPNACKIPGSCSGKMYMQMKIIPYIAPFLILFCYSYLTKSIKVLFKKILRYHTAIRYKKNRHQEREQRIAAGDLRAAFPRKVKAIKEDLKPKKTPEEKREAFIFYSVFIAFVLAFIAFLYFVLK